MIHQLIENFFRVLKEHRKKEQQKRAVSFLLSQMVGENFIRKDLMDEAERRNTEYEGYVTCENGKEILILRIVVNQDESWFAVHLFQDNNYVVEEEVYKNLNAEEAYQTAVTLCRNNQLNN